MPLQGGEKLSYFAEATAETPRVFPEWTLLLRLRFVATGGTHDDGPLRSVIRRVVESP